MESRLIFLQILYLFLKKFPSRRICMKAGLLDIIQYHCKMGNLTQTKMDVQPASPLAAVNSGIPPGAIPFWANV